MNTVLKCIVFLGMIILITPLYAFDISGDYLCTGYDPTINLNYDSDLTIAKTGDTYKFDWKEINDTYSGSGFVENNIVVSVFTSQGIKKKHGVMFYEMHDDDTLKGKWTYMFTESIGTENCKKIHKPSSETTKSIKETHKPISEKNESNTKSTKD